MAEFISISEFVNEGYLQEANRQFFHPLGLALEVMEVDGSIALLSGVWDYREDSEGIGYSEEVLASGVAKERAARVAWART